jgi:hypothetical protein
MSSVPQGNYDFSLHRMPKTALHMVGLEREPVLIIDDVIANPMELVDYAAREVQFAPADGPSGGYPGLRAPAPLNYVGALVKALDPVVREAFELENAGLVRASCNLSMVTRQPDQLKPLQRVPHIDTTDPLQFAFLHYLCDSSFGGTAFYRHRATGFEAITPERLDAYDEARDAEMVSAAPPSDYIRGSTAFFEQTAAFEARLGRLLVYRSRVLHSGQIPSDARFSSDPRDARLTANMFVNYGIRSR